MAARIALCILQVAAYQLGLLLPKEQQPLPMGLFRIGDSSSNVVPNGGQGTYLLLMLAVLVECNLNAFICRHLQDE